MNTATQGRAAFLALLACAVLSFVDNFVIAVSEEAGLWQFQIVRAAMALPLLFGFAYLNGARLRPVNPIGLCWRSGIVGVGLLLYFAALSVLPVAQAGAGLFSAPLWILVFSALFFGQRLTLPQVCFVLIGFVGVLLLLQPDLASLGWLSGMSILAGAVYGLGMLLTPHFCSNEHPIALSIGVIGAIGVISVPFAIYFSLFPSQSGGFLTAGWTAMSGRFLALTLLQAVGAAVAVTLIAEAYRTGAPSFVAVVEYSFLVFATIWGFVIWNISPNGLGLIGIGIILAVAMLLYRLGKMTRAPRLGVTPVGK